MLPNITGMQVYKVIRHSYKGVVIMLIACDDDESEIEGLKLVVNDYLRKPIKPEILLRIKKLLFVNENNQYTREYMHFGELKIITNTLEAFLGRD